MQASWYSPRGTNSPMLTGQSHQNKPNKSAIPMLIFLDKQPRLLYTLGVMRESNNHRGRGMKQGNMEFPKTLAEKYQPQAVGDFIGIERPRAVLTSFLKAPHSAAFLFLGPSGTGKTTMALVLARALPGEVQRIPSRECDLERVQSIAQRCQYFPWSARFHFVLIDEADQMTHAAQLAFLSLLDATAFPPMTVFVFTANATDLLESRFLSRCLTLNFGTVGIEQDLARFLAGISQKETGRKNGINFAAIAKAAEGNVRDALMKLELEILAGGVPEEKPKRISAPAVRQAIQTIYQERAAKAVATRNRRILEAAGVAA